MELFSKHAWIFFILGTIVMALLLTFRSKKYIVENPELQRGYVKYIKGILVYCNIPWVIMGLGNILGFTRSTFDYFNPTSLNPAVLVFHCSVVTLWVLLVNWVYFKGGAEFIEDHPGLIRIRILGSFSDVTASQIKLFLPLILLGGLIAMVRMWVEGFPPPDL